MKRHGIKLGSFSFKVGAGKQRSVSGKLNRKGRALLRRLRKIRVRVKIVARKGTAKDARTVTVTLKAKR